MKFVVLLLWVVVVAAPGSAQHGNQKASKANKPDFSGKWIVDSKKSEFMKGASLSKITEGIARKEGTSKENVSYPIAHIEHVDPELRVVEKGGFNDRVLSEVVYYSDGRGESNTGGGGGTLDSKSKWDGKRLVTTVFKQSQTGKKSNKIVSRISWELSKDGNTLTKLTTPADPATGTQPGIDSMYAVFTTKLVYQRARD